MANTGYLQGSCLVRLPFPGDPDARLREGGLQRWNTSLRCCTWCHGNTTPPARREVDRHTTALGCIVCWTEFGRNNEQSNEMSRQFYGRDRGGLVCSRKVALCWLRSLCQRNTLRGIVWVCCPQGSRPPPQKLESIFVSFEFSRDLLSSERLDVDIPSPLRFYCAPPSRAS